MVRPMTEYANTIWGPHYLLDKETGKSAALCNQDDTFIK